MSFATFVAGQLRKPSGLFGRLVVACILNRSNAPMNELTLKLLALAPDDRGFTLYEPEQVRVLLESAGFRNGDLVAGSSRLGEFFCAAGTK